MEGVQTLSVAICTPTITEPHPAYSAALQASVQALKDAGIEAGFKLEIGNVYISAARATLLRHALDGGVETVVFIDHDMSWRPEDLVKLIQTPGDVVAGLYRFKKPGEPEEYMGALALDGAGLPRGRFADGTDTLVLLADLIPAGFMKITRAGVERFMRAYPDLCYGSPVNFSVDLFNHGAKDGAWWGEDYAFSRNWLACGGELLVIPDLDLTHHSVDAAYPFNLHHHLMSRLGGALDPARADPNPEERP